MEKYIEDALNSVDFLVGSVIVEKDWVLEKFRDKITVKINKILKGK